MPVRRNVMFGERTARTPTRSQRYRWFDEGKRTLAAASGRSTPASTGRGAVSRTATSSATSRSATAGDEGPRPQQLLRLVQPLHDEVNVFVGARHDILRRDPDTGWKIARRLILLDQNVLLSKVITTFF